jgi:hypothetical protein
MAISNLGKASTLKNWQGSDRRCSSKKESITFSRAKGGLKHLPNSYPGRRTITKSVASQVNSKKYTVCTGGGKNRVAPRKRRLIFKGKTQKFYTLSRVAEAKIF